MWLFDLYDSSYIKLFFFTLIIEINEHSSQYKQPSSDRYPDIIITLLLLHLNLQYYSPQSKQTNITYTDY